MSKKTFLIFFPFVVIIGWLVDNYQNYVVSKPWYDEAHCMFSLRTEKINEWINK